MIDRALSGAMVLLAVAAIAADETRISTACFLVITALAIIALIRGTPQR